MKKMIAYLLALLGLFFSDIAFAQQEVDQQIDAATDSIVDIEHLHGEADIIGWEKDVVQVSGKLGENTEEFIFERNGKTIKIEVKVQSTSWSDWNSSSDGDDLVIKVPTGSRVKYSSTNADVTLDDILGGVDVEVINGEIEAAKIKGKIKLESVNGDITAEAVDGELNVQAVNGDIDLNHDLGDEIRVTAVNGDIRFSSAAADAKVETVNGDIKITLSNIDDVSLDTVNGSIDADMDLQEGALVRASSVGGRIDLNFDEGVEARFDIEAHAGGKIRNELTSDEEQKAKYGPRRWLEFNKGNPTSTIKANTVSGRITIGKK
ncbi:MAG: DUF4097 family beta strand repeat-containing protein [Pseudomonadota bacterium]